MKNSNSNETNKKQITRSKSELIPNKIPLSQFLDNIKNVENYMISFAHKKIYVKLYFYSTSGLAELSNQIKSEYDSNIEVLEINRTYFKN
jgi:uncharacterized membrane protein YcgQ (UPF0703/DUF1980 family)